MEGVVDHTMRSILTSLGGIDRCVTEFVRVTERLLPPRVFYRLCPELLAHGLTDYGAPVYVQLLGGQPIAVAENAARAAELGACGIDLNFGCPAKTVNRSDGGAILLREPARVHGIVSAARSAVPANVPVTVKTRLGFEDDSLFLDIARGIQAAGATELTVHARTRRQGYKPPAHWETIAKAREILHIPVIANGEIWSVEDALRCRESSGCSDLMLGRGALCRPDLPRLVQSALHPVSPAHRVEPLTWQAIMPLLLAYFELNLATYDARYVGNPIKQWLAYLRRVYWQAALLFERIKRLHEPEKIRSELLAELATQPTDCGSTDFTRYGQAGASLSSKQT